MTDLKERADFRQAALLRDGTPVVIRAIRPDDVNKVVAAFHKLDPQSVYTRFFSYKKELNAEDLGRLRGADFTNAVVLVVARGIGPEEVLIGGVSYYVHTAANGKQVAELAFTIEQDYQGQGLSSRLMALVIDIARDQGISQFEAEVLSHNSAMLKVFQRSGLPMTATNQEGVVHVVLALANQPVPP